MSTTTRSERSAAQASSASRHPGPPLSVTAVAFLVFFVINLVNGPISGKGTVPSPYSPSDVILKFVASSGDHLVLGGTLLFVSSVFLLVFAAMVQSRLQFLAPNTPGPVICGYGLSAAGVLLALTGLLQAVLGQPYLLSVPALVQGVQYMQFLFGGPGHTALLGVGVIGFAMTTLAIGRIPRWVSVLGVVLGVISVIACVAVPLPAFSAAIPIGRFTCMIWLVVVAFLVPRERVVHRQDA